MTWRVVPTSTFTSSLRRLDRQAAQRVLRTLQAIADSGQPQARGKPLRGPLRGFWRYRIGDYRVVVEIQEHRLVILALEVGHRSSVYSTHQTRAQGKKPR